MAIPLFKSFAIFLQPKVGIREIDVLHQITRRQMIVWSDVNVFSGHDV